MDIVYLAPPLGFTESTLGFMDTIESLITNCGNVVVNPWRMVDQKEFNIITPNIQKRKQILHKVNMKIAAQNAEAIRKCQIAMVVLDGTDVDSGTASEIGFAYASGKRIYG